jgi:hypothetical protein
MEHNFTVRVVVKSAGAWLQTLQMCGNIIFLSETNAPVCLSHQPSNDILLLHSVVLENMNQQFR